MIKIIELQNFKNHQDTRIILANSNLHALVGPNSSGKTTILQALYYLTRITEQPVDKFFSGQRDGRDLITSGQAGLQVKIYGKLEGSFIEWSGSYTLKKTIENSIVTTVDWEIDGVLHTDDSPHKEIYSQILNTLNHTVFLKLSAEKLVQAAYSDQVAPTISYDGFGLAPALDSLKNERLDKFNELQRFLQQIIPGIREIGIRRAKVPVTQQRSIDIDGRSFPFDDSKEMTGQEIVFNVNSGRRIPAHAVSEGTIIALGLLAVIMGINRPNLLLLDDIEQGLHPKAQIELINVLKKIIYAYPDLQIIFTTHSPYIIDELKPSQVHVLNTTSEGYAVVKRLDEHPNVQKGLEVLTTGEFWDAEGEEWILAEEKSG